MGDYEDRIKGEQVRMFDVDQLPTEQQVRVKALQEWLEGFHERSLDETIRKAVEYGGADLDIMAKAMLCLVPEEYREQTLGVEMAIAFYALGKVARLFGAYERGQRPSEDTWFDLSVYARMGLKVREQGRWF